MRWRQVNGKTCVVGPDGWFITGDLVANHGERVTIIIEEKVSECCEYWRRRARRLADATQYLDVDFDRNQMRHQFDICPTCGRKL